MSYLFTKSNPWQFDTGPGLPPSALPTRYPGRGPIPGDGVLEDVVEGRHEEAPRATGQEPGVGGREPTGHGGRIVPWRSSGWGGGEGGGRGSIGINKAGWLAG